MPVGEITIVNFNELMLIIYADAKAERAFDRSYRLAANTLIKTDVNLYGLFLNSGRTGQSHFLR